MAIDLRTVSITPLRQTFGHLARRMGADKPASRYMEATMDLQPVENYHYRPTWEPQYEIFDTRRTAITMKDWYALKDPRQYYYGAWTLARGKMQEVAEGDFDLVDELGLAAAYPAAGKEQALKVFLPLRHVAWASNLNKAFVSSYGYGIAISQATCYASMDQLGVAQYVSRLGLACNDLDALAAAKTAWLEGAEWQELRRYVEDLMVEKDWFEVLVAQDFALEGLLYPLIYERFNEKLNADYSPVFSMLTRFQREWFGETSKWLDAVLKATAADNPENKAQLAAWIGKWRERALVALKPVAVLAFGDEAEAILGELADNLNARAAKAGIAL
ncbi:phenol 2-monooxygenase P1 subunit [Azonexus fungiphilus]|uniref:Phenol 2-monooxygenase P1 subunit n=1 Tax=Azonexus fungiphilus TaxID=146940 RepID=A0A495WFI2_9RHOO|nr:phenol hydroxylase [Azonexus fungiphilus]RKT60462.1 phenol 2-monooxygenase P1 subunit [Azonexus fungiphilus]